MERLTEKKYAARTNCKEGVSIHRILDKLADYEDVEEGGRMVKLPVAIGGRLFQPSLEFRRVIDWVVRGYRLTPTNVIYIDLEGDVEIKTTDIGVAVFLSEDDAEKKLEKMEADAGLFI